MSPFASRRIESIQLCLPFEGNILQKLMNALDLLKRQHSTSHLVSLDLALRWTQQSELITWRLHSQSPAQAGFPSGPLPIWGSWYDDLLLVLGRGSSLVKVQRRILATSPAKLNVISAKCLLYWEKNAKGIEEIFFQLHSALKGEVLWDGKILMQNGDIIGKNVWERMLISIPSRLA
jgi:hypothetical protein